MNKSPLHTKNKEEAFLTGIGESHNKYLLRTYYILYIVMGVVITVQRAKRHFISLSLHAGYLYIKITKKW